uniref:FBA_2 domain-containing protein n=1 Tax=Steinernema glaseri TaxID=37863 RepID=A0A1I7YEP8_9BILA
MDDVPFAFCESVCEILYKSEIWAAKHLSGHYGQLACIRFQESVFYYADVKGGVEQKRYIKFDFTGERIDAPEKIDVVSKKQVRSVLIHFSDGKKESVSKGVEIVRRFPYASFSIEGLSWFINENSIDFLCSIKRLDYVDIMKKLDDNALRAFGKLVSGQKLSRLSMFSGACDMEVLKPLLCQDQFKTLEMWNGFEYPWEDWNGTTVGDLLQFWSENSEKLRGKNLVLEMNCSYGAEQLEQFVLRGTAPAAPGDLKKALKVCSKEECDFLKFRHNHFNFIMPSCIYKYEDPCEKGRLYVSFDCSEVYPYKLNFPAGYYGHNDLGLLKSTSLMRILFA